MEASARFRLEPASVAAARRFAVEQVQAGGREQLAAPVALVVSELATNAMLHARSDFVVDVRTREDVEVGVTDFGPGRPTRRARHRASDEPGGRGLAILDAVCRAWGVQERHPGKRVWCSVQDGTTPVANAAAPTEAPGPRGRGPAGSGGG